MNLLTTSAGLGDVNAVRVKVTEATIAKCDDIFAMVMTQRAATDDGVAKVFKLAEPNKNVGIVCTMSDVRRPCILSPQIFLTSR